MSGKLPSVGQDCKVLAFFVFMGELPDDSRQREWDRLSVFVDRTLMVNFRSFCIHTMAFLIFSGSKKFDFVHLQSLRLISLRKENERDPMRFSTRRIQNELWEVVRGAISDERVTVAGEMLFSLLLFVAICDVFDVRSDNFVAVFPQGFFLRLVPGSDEGCDVEALGAIVDRLISAVRSWVLQAKAIDGIRANALQEREQHALVMWRAVVEDGKHSNLEQALEST